MKESKHNDNPHVFQEGETIKICGHDYAVEYSDEMHRDGDIGRTDPELNLIRIYPGMAPSQQISVFIHEVGETINDECKLKHSSHTKLTVEYNEVWQFIFDNLDLIDRLAQHL